MGILSPQLRVAVLRGGPSSDYESSLKTGEHVLSVLREKPDAYHPIDVFLSKDGEWHVSGLRRDPHKALAHVDVVFNALHGEYGEDGQVQKLLSALRIPYTGSTAMPLALTKHKDLSKKAFETRGLFTPKHELVTREDTVQKLASIFRNYLHPIIVKPRNADSMRGLNLAYTFDELLKAVEGALEHSEGVMLEEFIRGKEAVCAVVENARGQKLYAMLPIEVATPKKNKIPDYEAKLKEKRSYVVPGNFSVEEHKLIEHAAKEAHVALGLRHYSKSDVIVTPQNKVYVIESTGLPALHKGSVLYKSLPALGWSPAVFVEHLITLALTKTDLSY
jgi:D-alanine-D-alanine ligase